MFHRYPALLGMPLAVCALCVASAAAQEPNFDKYSRNYWHYSSYYGVSNGAYCPTLGGYDLDDVHHGYYGGSRYREYYSVGRSGGFGMWPGPEAYRYPPRPKAVVYGPEMGEVPYHAVVVPPEPNVTGPLDGVQLQDPATAHIVVLVPENAAIVIDGHQTTQTGPTRDFVSPQLAPGQAFTYEIKARWQENGQEIEKTKKVSVKAGARVVVHFPNGVQPDLAAKPLASAPVNK